MIEGARELGAAALANLERNRRRIDDLNVYPVPDGDTGTNLTLSVRAIVEALNESASADRAALAKELTRAALMGARGNSGVILSQIVRGFAEVLGERHDLAAAFRSASDAAYRAVKHPVEGTMLTVIRELAEAAEATGRADPSELLRRVVEHGEEALARTPEQLPILKEAGVVNAGGAGLLEIVRGLALAAAGEAVPEAEEELEELSHDAIHQELSRFRYCTVFVVEGDGLDAEALERELEAIGDSLLVVGDADALKVHMHTDEPGAALAVATRLGVIEGVEIANMHRQAEEREQRLLAALPETGLCGVVAVVAGEGNRRLVREPRRDEGDRGRPDDEPLRRPDPRSDRRDRRRGGARPAEQLQHRADRRAGRADGGEAGPRRSCDLDPGRARGDGRFRHVPLRRGERRGDGRDRRRGRDGRGHGRLAGCRVERPPDHQGRIPRTARGGARRGRRRVRRGGALGDRASARGAARRAHPAHRRGRARARHELAELAERYPALEVDVHAGGQPHYPLLLSAE